MGVPVRNFNIFRVPSTARYREIIASTLTINCQLVSATSICKGRQTINATVQGDNVPHRRLFVAAGT